MFLPVPITRYNESLDIDEEIILDLNPFHVVSIEPHEQLKNACTVWLVNEGTIEVNLSQKRLNQKITAFIKESVLTKIYNDMRTRGN